MLRVGGSLVAFVNSSGARLSPHISIQFAHKVVTLVKFFQRVDVISKLLCRQLPIARHAKVLVQVLCQKIAASTCWWDKSYF